MTPNRNETPRRWWREPMLWLIVGGPATVVVASIATAVVAWRGADALEPTDTASISQPSSMQAALKARNHAAEPADR